MSVPESKFFATAAAWWDWLAANHDKKTELVLGFYKKTSGKTGITYPEALDVALCLGWIDGVRRTLDAASYSVRFSPRKPGSIWSRVNLAHVERLRKAGRMLPPGLKVHAARKPEREGIYSFENAPRELGDIYETRFRVNAAAWDFFQRQPPSYRRVSIWWVVSAKKEETRARRLLKLIEDSARGKRLEVVAGKSPA